MWEFKTHRDFGTYGKFKLTGIVLFLFLSFGCKEECVTSYTLYEAYYQAVIYPENFDNYVQDNQMNFDDDFFNCLNDKKQDISDQIKKEQKLCDQAHVQGSDFWHDCYDEIDQEYVGTYNALIAIYEVAKNQKSFNQTDFGIYAIFGKNLIGKSEWENLMSQAVPANMELLECEKCEKKFFLF